MSEEQQKSEDGGGGDVTVGWSERVMESALSTVLYIILETLILEFRRDIINLEEAENHIIQKTLGAKVLKIVKDMEPVKEEEKEGETKEVETKEEEKNEEESQKETDVYPEEEKKQVEEDEANEKADREEITNGEKMMRVTLMTMAKYALGLFCDKFTRTFRERGTPEKEISELTIDSLNKLKENAEFIADPLRDIHTELKVGIYLNPERFFNTLRMRFDLNPDMNAKDKLLFAMTMAETRKRIRDLSSALVYIGKYIQVNVLTMISEKLNPIMAMLQAFKINITQTFDCGVCRLHWRKCLDGNSKYVEAVQNEAQIRINQRNFQKLHSAAVNEWKDKENARVAKVMTMLSKEELATVEENKYNQMKPIIEGMDPDLAKMPRPSDSTMSEEEWDNAENLRVARVELQKTGMLRPHFFSKLKEDTEIRDKLEEDCKIASQRAGKIIVAYKLAAADVCKSTDIPEGCTKLVVPLKFNAVESPFCVNIGPSYNDEKEIIVCPECKCQLCCKECMYRNVDRNDCVWHSHANSETCKAWKIIEHALNKKDPIKTATMIFIRSEENYKRVQRNKEAIAKRQAEERENAIADAKAKAAAIVVESQEKK